MTRFSYKIRIISVTWLITILICLPVLIPLAIYVRKNTLRMPEADGEKAGSCTYSSDNSKNLLFIGESPVAGVGVATVDQGLVVSTAMKLSQHLKCTVNWQATGVNGADISYCIDKLLPEIIGQKIDFLVISLGVNDTKNLTQLSVWHHEITRFIDSLKHPDICEIYFLATPDMSRFPALPNPLGFLLGIRSRLLNHVTQNHPYSGKNFTFIDSSMKIEPEFLAEDGFHPSAKGCDEMGQVISSFIANQKIPFHQVDNNITKCD